MTGRILYGATIFLSAFLLFQVQPVIGKYILPWFGSSPGVWATCLLFFQILLLGGYTYAHFVVSRLSPKRQAIVHAVLLGLALLTLPITPSTEWKPTGEEAPVGRILIVLAFSVGLPYLLLSSTGPLIQGWFARLHPGRSPYRLYALSNVGSLLALLSYPFLVEPALRLKEQTSTWSIGYVVFALACAGCAWVLARGVGREARRRDETDAVSLTAAPTKESERAPGWGDVIAWFLLAACASALLLATTNQMCLDIAVIPFLWILPLSLYLISFILTFDHERWYVRPIFLGLLPLVLLVAFARLRDGVDTPIEQQVAGYAVALFVCCMCCHGELSRSKPTPRYLTFFFLIVSLGGAAGGLLVALGAPTWLEDFHEFPLLLGACFAVVLVVAVRQVERERAPFPEVWWLRAVWGLVWLGCFALVVYASVRLFSERFWLDTDETAKTKKALHAWFDGLRDWAWAAPVVVLLIFEAVRWRRGRSFGAWWLAPKRHMLVAGSLVGCLGLLAVTGAVGWSVHDRDTNVIVRGRNFYGVLTVKEYYKDRPWHDITLSHGRIMHGFQLQSDKNWPTSYYGPESGVGMAVRLHPRLGIRSRPFRIGIVGLGTGTMAAYANQRIDPVLDDENYVQLAKREPGDYVRFYEINPLVVDWAWNHFTFLEDAKARGADVGVYLGDARLVMERQLAEGKPEGFDVLAIDAFSSDAIPIHLLTKESLEIYWKHLNSDGVLALHVTNRYINLKTVVRRLADELDVNLLHVEAGENDDRGLDSSDWLLMTNNARIRSRAKFEGNVRELPEPGPLWTDDFSSVFEVLSFVEEYAESDDDVVELDEGEEGEEAEAAEAASEWPWLDLAWWGSLVEVKDRADVEGD
ncbi:MAG: hypothetical protein QNJ90_06730 [Planctomycetota bacterium]|nr:hypothetical protein [Planctomycetota bacterium]